MRGAARLPSAAALRNERPRSGPGHPTGGRPPNLQQPLLPNGHRRLAALPAPKDHSMRTNSIFQNGFLISRILLALALISAAAFLTVVSFAANPSSTNLSPATATPVNWTGTGK